MALSRRGGVNGNAMSTKRIKKEIADLAKENLGSLILTPNESNIFLWKATLPGPAGSPYEGGMFDVDIRVPDDYPFSPPQLQFMTKVYHCNIASSGAICLDLLKTAWSPALSLYKVILSLSSLLTDPNPSDPLVPAIAQEYKKDRKKHDRIAREWVQTYALPKESPPVPIVAAPVVAPRRTTATSSTARRAPTRSTNATQTAQPIQIAGTRRSNPFSANGVSSHTPIDLADDSDHDDPPSDVEVLEMLGGSSRSGNVTRGRGERATKRLRTNDADGHEGHDRDGSGPGGDDVIVIDD